MKNDFQDINQKSWYSETGKQWLSKGKIVNIQINKEENCIRFFFDDGSIGEISSYHEVTKEGNSWSAVILSDIIDSANVKASGAAGRQEEGTDENG